MKKTVPDHAILIPDHAEKVFEGQIFTFYQWPQEMFDGTVRAFEMLKRPDTVQIIAVKDGKIILVKDEQPGRSVRTHFPGGRADDDDESWLVAAQREMREETGMAFQNWRLIAVEQPQPKIEWFTPWYLATELVSEESQQLDAGGEKIEVMEWEFEEVRRYVLSGAEPTLSYAIPLMNAVSSLDELLQLPAFAGKEVDR